LVRPSPRRCNSELKEVGSPESSSLDKYVDADSVLSASPSPFIEGKSEVGLDIVKVLQMYHVRVVSAIAQQKWRHANGIVDPSTKGDAKHYWTPLIDPKKDFKDCSPAHLRGVYCRLRAAAVEAGVDGEPELDPSYWRSQLSGSKQAPVGSGPIGSIPQRAPVHGAGAFNSELTERAASQTQHIDDVEDLASSPIIVEGVSQSSLRQALGAMKDADAGEIECDEVPAHVAVAACTTSPEQSKSTSRSELLTPLCGLSGLARWRSIQKSEVVAHILTALRTLLYLHLGCGCFIGDTAAMGASLLLAAGVHANTKASCSAFTMLVILGFDARLGAFRAKIILCAISVLAPLFPPKQRSAAPKARAHDP
jgi:hypothetical protein